MSLTIAQTAYFESRLGTMDAGTAADVESRLSRLGGAGYEPAAAAELLQIRLATMVRDPAKFAIPGDYSQDTTANITELRDMLDLAMAEAGSDDAASLLHAVLPATQRWSR